MTPIDDPPRHLLLATDFGARSDRAQDRAVRLALRWNATLTAVHAVSDAATTDDAAASKARRMAAMRDAGLMEREFAAIPGLRAAVLVTDGQPREVLLEIAAKERAGLIVTGIAGNGPLGQAMVGSTVTALAQRSPVPVLAVRKKPSDRDGHVVVATDLSETSEPAARLALGLFPGESLALFHAFDPRYRGFAADKGRFDAQAHDAAVAQGRDFLLRLGGAAAAKMEIVARRGDPEDLLATFVDERHIDLVVVGTHGRTGLAHAFLGSVAARILNEVACDVLVVPSGRG